MKELTLDGFERFTLYQIVPENIGSLEESLRARNLRDRLLSEDLKDEIDWQEVHGQVNFNPQKLSGVDSTTFEFDGNDVDIIAYGFLHDEQEGEVPTNDQYTSLLREFIDDVHRLKEED